jgi:hypothetical protein
MTEERYVTEFNISVEFAKFLVAGGWFESSDELWYQNTDGNPEEGVSLEHIYENYYIIKQ